MTNNEITVKQALQLAIDEEVKAYNLYSNLKNRVTRPGTKEMLNELAKMELGHKNVLEDILKDSVSSKKLGARIPEQSQGITEFLVKSELVPDSTTQEILIFAMKEEAKAAKFYHDLENYFKASELEELFHRLCLEENGHKVRLEDEYEEHYMKEN